MIESPTELMVRVRRLEELMPDFRADLLGASDGIVRLTEEDAQAQLQAGQQNFLPNGDFDYTRNRYYYAVDYASVDGRVDGDVSEEAAFWFTASRDTAITSYTGAISATDATLTITPDGDIEFLAGHVGKEIVVEGAGTGGADLVTTILSLTSNGEVELSDAAATTVSNARVRWNLQELKEDSTDVDYEAGETAPSLFDVPDNSVSTVTATTDIVCGNNPIRTVLADTTSGDIDLSLESAEKVPGRIVAVKKIDASGNKVTVLADGSETIDGAAYQQITVQYTTLMMVSDGSDWWIL